MKLPTFDNQREMLLWKASKCAVIAQKALLALSRRILTGRALN